MSDPYFQILKKKFGERTRESEVAPDAIERFRGLLPNRLLSIWQEEGWSAYSNGLLWLVNPDEFQFILDEWLEETPFPTIDRYRVIARTAFGDLYAWGERTNREIKVSPLPNWIAALANDVAVPAQDRELGIGYMFSSISVKACDCLDEAGNSLFEQGVARLGKLEPDEIYGFEPAIVLGGRLISENMRKLKMHVHLSMLRGFAAPLIPNIRMPAI